MAGKPRHIRPSDSPRKESVKKRAEKQQLRTGFSHRSGPMRNAHGESSRAALNAQYGSDNDDDNQEIVVRPGQIVKVMPPETDSEAEDEPEQPPRQGHPQERIARFWSNFEPEYEGGIVQILPDPVVKTIPASTQTDLAVKAVTSYSQARDQCVKSVKKIVRECRSLNQKYTDAHFDIEHDLKVFGLRNCLDGLINPRNTYYTPEDVKRVTEIFKEPQFYKDGASFDDVVQGLMGDCWLLAALSALTSNEELLQKICVIQDQEVGVYGFVFFRDGEWQPCIVDDKLYLRAPSYEESDETVLTKYYVKQNNEERRYKKVFQTGSKALYFAGCRDENETWVPLLEKAFAKAHGDYLAISGGQTGEALEDLTGGVTTEFYTTNIISKDRFWEENLSHTGKEFLFSCAMASYTNWRLADNEDDSSDKNRIRDARKKGIEDQHAYAILATYEGYGQRLVKVRNPWGHQEWSGAWSDGSKEWTTEWLSRLKHNFGDDGVFWMSYDDLLRKYKFMERTRIFGPEWHVAQQWTSVQVPWNTSDYQQTKFTLSIPEDSETVIVLSQLDDRYFRGFQGEYIYKLHFRVQNDAETDSDDYIARSPVRYDHWRSTNVEIFLEKGNYTVLIKVEAWKTGADDIETVIRANYRNRSKIAKIATLYDLAHAKGRLPKKETKPEAEAEAKEKATDTGAKEAETEANKNATKPEDEAKESVPLASEIDKTENGKPNSESSEAEPAKEEAKKEDEANIDAPAEDSKSDAAAPTAESPTDPVLPLQETDSEEAATPEIPDPCRIAFNAFCTVGLRVYSKIPDLQLKVVLPSEERNTILDRDDIAKASLDEIKQTTAVTTNGDTKGLSNVRGKSETKNDSDDSSSSSSDESD